MREKLYVQVMWGPRADTVEDCARRWLATIRALAPIDEILAEWVVNAGDEADEWATVPMTEADVLPIVRGSAGVGPGEPMPELGCSFGTTNAHGGELAVYFHATAGQRAPVPGLVNQARLEAHPSSPGELRRWYVMAEAVLAVLVEAWEPDHGEVWTRPSRGAQGCAPRQPWAGLVTYVSPHRREFAPADVAATGRTTRDGGLLVSLIGPDGTPPPDDTVVALGSRLREAGAFEPIPVERDRW